MTSRSYRVLQSRLRASLIGTFLVTVFVLASLSRTRIYSPLYVPRERPIVEDGMGYDLAEEGILKNTTNIHERYLWKRRSEDVKNSFLHAWNSYEQLAWGADELRPITGDTTNNVSFNGWGVSIVDSLDTLLIMDLRPQFTRSMEHVEKLTFAQHPDAYAPFFETIIRYLGGLLSAHALVSNNSSTSGLSWQPEVTRDNKRDPAFELQIEHHRTKIAKILLDKADQLGQLLMPAFKTASHLPTWGVNTVNGNQKTGMMLLAEIGSYQLEFKYLAYLTNKREYFDAAQATLDLMDGIQKAQLANNSSMGGMLPTTYNSDVIGDDFMSIGSWADSTYEYFLKGYLLTGRSETRLLKMYLASVETALKKLVFISDERQLTYITDAHGSTVSHRLEHLSCFYPGLLMLGVQSLGKNELSEDMLRRHALAAEGILESCYLLYRDNPTHLGSEEVAFQSHESNLNWWETVFIWEGTGRITPKPPGIHGPKTEDIAFGGKGSREYTIRHMSWLMRPETVESLFIMFRITGDPIWRRRCYDIYQGMEKHSRLKNGYGALKNAALYYELDPQSPDYKAELLRHLENSMPSYALAETFKYLFLCMLDPEDSEALLPSRKWIFNTEAHPLPVFEWTPRQWSEWDIK